MEFYTSSKQKRPVRLCEETRRFAKESQNFRYGRDTLRTPCVSLDHIEDFEYLSDIEKYNAAIDEIVTKAPIRIVDGELISGSETLGDAIKHNVPASYKGEEFGSTSHLTVDFQEVLEIGIDGIRKNRRSA